VTCSLLELAVYFSANEGEILAYIYIVCLHSEFYKLVIKVKIKRMLGITGVGCYGVMASFIAVFSVALVLCTVSSLF
jgi:hypothetical protein